MSRWVAIALAAAAVALGGCSGGGDAGPAAALSPPESSWVPGQKPLGVYPEFQAVFERAVTLAQKRRKQRELGLERIARAKIASQKRAQEEARRRYLEAKRRAERAYKLALKRAAEERRRQEERIRRIKEELARKRRAREEKLKVRPGEECGLPNVRKRFRCKTGRLPDPATDNKKDGGR